MPEFKRTHEARLQKLLVSDTMKTKRIWRCAEVWKARSTGEQESTHATEPEGVSQGRGHRVWMVCGGIKSRTGSEMLAET
jgi:hypothetical protein